MRGILATAVLAAALLTAGCGGSSSNSSTPATEATTEATTDTTTMAVSTDSADTTSSTEATTDESTEATTDESTEATTTDSDANGALAGFSEGCKKVANLSLTLSAALGAASGSGGDSSPDLQKTAEAYKEFAAKVPEEIRPAFQTFADAFAKYAAVFKGVKLKPGQTPDAQTIAKLAAAAKAFDSQDVKDAEQQISKWAENNCSSAGG